MGARSLRGLHDLLTRHDGTRLAILGGKPTFEETLHVGRPNLGDRKAMHRALDEILDRRWLSNRGPVLQQFEARLAEYVGVRHVVATCNATIALEIAFRAADLAGRVIVPSFTFVATAHALLWQGLSPIFADVDPRTHNLHPASVEAAITPDTTAIVGVHLWGQPCNVEALQEIADRHNLTLLFDAAHAFGCSHGGRMVGSFGHAEVFSFHATKFFNTFEGGAIATDDEVFARRARLMHNFGFAGLDTVSSLGTNGKMTEFAAAVGLVNMETLTHVIEVNRELYDAYVAGFRDVLGVELLTLDRSDRRNFQYVVVEVDGNVAPLTRDELLAALHCENVRARRYFYPGCHRMEPYATLYPQAGNTLPATERLCESTLVLPSGPQIDRADATRICRLIERAFDNARDVRDAIQRNEGIGQMPFEP